MIVSVRTGEQMGDNEQSESEGRPILADSRRTAILETLRTAGAISVGEIEAQFGVSSMTARRDLAELERRGLAQRTHGGAVLPSIASHEDSFASRVERDVEAKQKLAARAAELVADGESVLLDGSSSAYFVAKALAERGTRATVITNSLPIMELIGTLPTATLELVGVGGMLRRLTSSFVGPVANRTVEAHAADRLFFSVKGVSRDGSLTDADALEADLKRVMISRSAEATLLVDAPKLRSRGLNVVARLDVVDAVIAHGLAQADLDAIALAGPKVVKAA
jgi:DeoR/GlpR family transcriptional regulator of sugar metabolism